MDSYESFMHDYDDDEDLGPKESPSPLFSFSNFFEANQCLYHLGKRKQRRTNLIELHKKLRRFSFFLSFFLSFFPFSGIQLLSQNYLH